MKISMWIPKEKNPVWLQDFINKEIAQAGNIKSKETRKSVIEGLNTAQRLSKPGICLYIHGTDFDKDIYKGKEFKYYCGNDYIKPEVPSDFK